MYYDPYYAFRELFYDPRFAILMGVLAVVGIFAMIISLTFYIFGSLGLYTLAKRRGFDNAYLAWIPIASMYLLGSVYDDVNRRQGKQTNYGIILLALFGGSIVVTFMSTFIPFLAFLSGPASLAGAILMYFALYYIYKDYTPNNTVLFLVLSVILGIVPILLFAIRNKPPISIVGQQGHGYQPPQPPSPPPYNGYQPPQH